ncbi:Sulfatase domain-containing protein [Pseudomonas sp. IT-P74]|uniref:Uncharacterized protein n=1 Tax=Pseudomonas fluorescens TaxID=294 RepID=A0A5E7VKD3_PSEFL|nr:MULTISPECIES: hypothetical protein [Pseudomonas]PBJ25865.1 hypothetical protein BSF44_13520 [Pseudomonas sp. ACN8]VVQ23221.1 hypothetical protein PS938_05362 [Pseudomonas fluorescens]
MSAIDGFHRNGSTFISLTSDPLRNPAAVLKACTLKQGINGPHWFFLTDDKVQMDLVWGWQCPWPAAEPRP